MSNQDYFDMAGAIKMLSISAIEQAKSGHPGMVMGIADVATVLFKDFLKFDPENPKWANRDRFVLSAGHGSMLLYSLLYLTGYKDITIEDIKKFRQLHSKTAGHPEYGYLEGIETTTGPLGQGLANAVGMALAERIMEAKFGSDLIDHYTYVIAGDGCLMEGISQEAISFAGHLGLNKLIVLFDDNGISIDGPTSLSTSDNHLLRFEASNWNVMRVDGHNPKKIIKALKKAKKSDKPTMIACKTTIANGSPNKAGSNSSHGSPLGFEETELVRKELNWNCPDFEVPENISNMWLEVGNKCKQDYAKWKDRLLSKDKAIQDEFSRVINGTLPLGFDKSLHDLKQSFSDRNIKQATRKSSGDVVDLLSSEIPELVGGSADLTGSNNTKAKNAKPITRDNFSGNYIYYGIREHAMGSIMNGLSLYGGIIPFGGTFLVFSDYMRPAIRLSALMEQRVIYIMTHDSIGLGEDGPTHQPVEHLASLRAIPNLLTFRPADAVETAECWEIALKTKNSPSLLCLTRQDLPTLRSINDDNKHINLCENGAYIISECDDKNPNIIIIASGSEVSIAMEAKKRLEAYKEYKVRIVSLVCSKLFDLMSDDYKNSVIGNMNDNNILRVGVEAALSFGFERYIGNNGIFIGMNSFGASAPAKELYEYFGITAANIEKQILLRLSSK